MTPPKLSVILHVSGSALHALKIRLTWKGFLESLYVAHHAYTHLFDQDTAKLTTNIEARVFVPKPRYNGSNPLNESADESESSDDADESSDDEKTPLTVINTILVNLSGVPKDTIPMKHKAFHDANWPPCRPRAFREISQNSSIASYEAFMAFPAAVKRMEDSCGGPDGEKIDVGEHNTKN
ncbi:hypothetical protein EDC04DRAFT_2893188 [Pisolithus marmoratus]|nr:hypothetical protein EDC04DRAFT_2893188 [Pisolithus marmoratus]